MAPPGYPAYGFKVTPPQGPDDKKDPAADEESTVTPEERKDYILCRTCFQVITTKADRLEIQGGHRHSFANPAGIVFEIGCFQSARCRYAGLPSSEFTWFRGFRWRFAVCSTCLSHVGWLFISESAYRFHGLILDRLIFLETE